MSDTRETKRIERIQDYAQTLGDVAQSIVMLGKDLENKSDALAFEFNDQNRLLHARAKHTLAIVQLEELAERLKELAFP